MPRNTVTDEGLEVFVGKVPFEMVRVEQGVEECLNLRRVFAFVAVLTHQIRPQFSGGGPGSPGMWPYRAAPPLASIGPRNPPNHGAAILWANPRLSVA